MNRIGHVEHQASASHRIFRAVGRCALATFGPVALRRISLRIQIYAVKFPRSDRRRIFRHINGHRFDTDHLVSSVNSYLVVTSVDYDPDIELHHCSGVVITTRLWEKGRPLKLRETDILAKRALKRAFPGRKIAQVGVTPLIHDGGGLHCYSRNQPIASATAGYELIR